MYGFGRMGCWWPVLISGLTGLTVQGLQRPPYTLPRHRLPTCASACAFTNIEAGAKAVISTAIHPCHFRQSICFDVDPPFVGQEPITRNP